MSEWQPIETAPKDETRILIGWWDDGVWEQRAAYWDKDFDIDRKAWTDGAVESFGYEEIHEYHPTPLAALTRPTFGDLTMMRIIYRLWMRLTAGRRRHKWVFRGEYPKQDFYGPMICSECGYEYLQLTKIGCRGYKESP